MATMVLAFASAVSGSLRLATLSQAEYSGVSERELIASEARQDLIDMLHGIAYLGTAISFLIWFVRAHRNLICLGNRDLRYSSKWAAAWFFVPFLSLVRPFQIMREIYHGSTPEAEHAPPNAIGHAAKKARGTPPMVGWWWALFWTSNILANLALRSSLSRDNALSQLRESATLMLLSDIVELLAAIAALYLVTRVMTWQEQRGHAKRDTEHDLDRAACPFCAEDIRSAARICRFCHNQLPDGWNTPTPAEPIACAASDLCPDTGAPGVAGEIAHDANLVLGGGRMSQRIENLRKEAERLDRQVNEGRRPSPGGTPRREGIR